MKMTLNHGIMKLLHWLTKFYTWHVIYSNITPTIDLPKKPHPPFPMEAKEGGIKWHINLLTLKRFANIKNKWIFLIKKVHILVAIGNNAFGGLRGTMARHVSSTNSFIHDNFLRGGIMSKFLAYSELINKTRTIVNIRHKTKKQNKKETKIAYYSTFQKTKNKHKKEQITFHIIKDHKINTTFERCTYMKEQLGYVFCNINTCKEHLLQEKTHQFLLQICNK